MFSTRLSSANALGTTRQSFRDRLRKRQKKILGRFRKLIPKSPAVLANEKIEISNTNNCQTSSTNGHKRSVATREKLIYWKLNFLYTIVEDECQRYHPSPLGTDPSRQRCLRITTVSQETIIFRRISSASPPRSTLLDDGGWFETKKRFLTSQVSLEWITLM
ncbi:LAMI_0D10022g1_1 [Lachancea mirantina]|uniref:LAMI_0D10022g1_1 n=1 Tax=Lachancea mirantina TaxID=1230905 RepID=A0A1G4JE86_9SACH|nr:LAMI_0D10022g1_1 [Lachancea mirantina]